MEVGDVGIKIAGREAGNICAVIDIIDENFVMVVGPRVRRRRCNVLHIKPLHNKLNIKKGATNVEVIDALLKAKLIKKEEIPVQKPKKEKKEQKKKEEKPKKKLISLPKKKRATPTKKTKVKEKAKK